MSESRAHTIPIYPAQDAAGEVVSMYVKEPTIYARSVHGWFAGWRWALVWFTQLLFYGLPWLRWNDRPAMLLDLAARRFYIGPLLLYPQDFIYLTGLLIVSAYGLFLFTAVAGRLWCGFACPQTVYTEIFMWVERRIEGDRIARMKRDAGPWTADKLLRRGTKQFVWISIGLWTGFTFVGYFTPIRELAAEAWSGSFGPWEWFWVLFYGFATYGNAGYMREQVCKYMCPYARFQSAMFDKDTLTISYDSKRGEPRGSRPRSTAHQVVVAQGKGDCIDCGLCVQVCPTGIDIRDGLQFECIGCAACVDVCNGVMDKMNYPRGLIRYATENELIKGWSKPMVWRRVFRPRVLVYGVILLLISTVFVVGLALRKPFRVDVIRDRGALARQVDDGQLENVYRLQVMNGTEMPQRYLIGVSGQADITIAPQAVQSVEVAPAEARWVVLVVRLSRASAARLGAGAHPMQFEISSVNEAGRSVTSVEDSTFVVPR